MSFLDSGAIQFYRSLANSAQSGLPLVTALGILAAGKPGVSPAALQDVIAQLQRGQTLSKALRAHPGEFPVWQIEMVAVGESTGRLDAAFADIAEILEERRGFLLAFLSGMAYPLIVLHVAPFLLFANKLVSEGAGPYLVSAAEMLLWFYVPAAALFALAKAGVLSRRHLPLGGLQSKIEFCSFLSAMLRAGVPHRRALDLSAAAAGVAAPRLPARAGESMLDCLKPYAIFSPDELARLEVAELSGQLDEDLRRLAIMLRAKWQAGLKTLSTLLPMLFSLAIALAVGYRIVTFYLDSFGSIPG